jgi:integrase
MADVTLAVIQGVANWFVDRSDSYVSPFAKLKKRSNADPRDRILSDEELRAVWKAAEAKESGAFGVLVRLLLATAQRLDKVLTMRWDNISADGVWIIPSEPREKGHGGPLRLPDLVLAVLKEHPRFAGNPHVFSGRTGGRWRDVWRPKLSFDERCGVTGWALHDCRRTARSLMSRAGVRPDIAERTLGHVVGSKVQRTYDRLGYAAEKAEALAVLSSLIQHIVNSPKG